jgi:hypothetical protein
VKVEELALQRKRFAHLSDEEWRWMLQQVEGRQRTHDKLPTFAQIEDWWYPIRLSCEQCSSEATARYKAAIIRQLGEKQDILIDLTGGYGVDTYFLSEQTAQAHYVERNKELCRIAQHNFQIANKPIHVHNTSAEDFLAQYPMAGSVSSDVKKEVVVYLDPARRDAHGGKVFRIEDCEPNIIKILPSLRATSNTILIKFSPMLDITSALQSLGNEWDVHVVALHNEVKEIIFVTGNNRIHAVNILHEGNDQFSFTRSEEKSALCAMADCICEYIYEPNAAIIKAGAFRLVSERYQLHKLDHNTHLYTADQLIENFPGRVWQMIAQPIKNQRDIAALGIQRAAILTRNYPLTPEELRKKFKLQESDSHFLIGARIACKPILLLAKRVY